MKKFVKIILFSLATVLILSACSNNDKENTNKNKGKQSETLESTRTFLENSYTKSDIKQITGFDELVSKRFKNQVKDQHQSFDTDNNLKKEASNIKLYKNVNGNSLEVMYSLHLKVTDDKEKNINYTERFGRINYKSENGKLKIDKLEEINSRQIDEE